MVKHEQPRCVQIYVRPGCHLCDDAEELLARLGAELPLQVERVNILSDPALYEQYKWTIPVIAIDGEPVLSAPIEEMTLRRALGLPGAGD